MANEWSGRVEQQSNLASNYDYDGSYETFGQSGTSTGATPQYGNSNSALQENLFYNQSGNMVGDRSYEMFNQGGTGEFSTGPFTFQKDNQNGWKDQAGGSWSNQSIDQIYGNLLTRQNNINNAASTSEAWMGANPLATGDTMGYQSLNQASGDGTQANPYISEPIYASSTNEYLDSRNDINNPNNIPTGTGGSGDGMFNFLKDFKLFGDR